MTPVMLYASIAVAGLAAASLGLLLFDRHLRRRRARRWHAYFHGGGLIRSLMRRWSTTPRLTDRRGEGDRR